MFKAMLVKEFRLVSRDKHALAALFIMPAIFILIMSMALKDTFGSDRALLNYTVVDRDNTSQSAKVAFFLAENDAMKDHHLSIINESQQKQALIDTLDFVLTIPAGFADNLRKEHDSTPFFQLYADSDVKPEMLTIFKTQLAMVIMRLQIDKIKEEISPYLPDAVQGLGQQNFNSNNFVDIRFNAMGMDARPTATQQSVPSWIVFGMFFVVIPMSTIFINERKQNTLMRISAMNISVPVLFAGKIAPYFIINQIQVWVMIAVGMFIVPLLGGTPLTLGNSIGGLVLISCGLSLAAIGMSVLIAVLAGTVEQATTIGGIINILLGAIGGIMVPKFIMPPLMQKIANFSPMSWGLDGFLDIFLRGQGAGAVVYESLILAGFGAVLLFFAGLVFKQKMDIA